MAEEANSEELSAFVASTLRAIANGISDAQDTTISSAHGSGVFGFAAPDKVEFDIAVSAKNTGAAGGGLKIAVFGIGANTNANIGTENSSVSRIKFAIPTSYKKNSNSMDTPSRTRTAWNG